MKHEKVKMKKNEEGLQRACGEIKEKLKKFG